MQWTTVGAFVVPLGVDMSQMACSAVEEADLVTEVTGQWVKSRAPLFMDCVRSH